MCSLPLNASVVTVHQPFEGDSTPMSDRFLQLRSDVAHTGSLNTVSLLQAKRSGRIDLFGRRHYVGIIPTALKILSRFPKGIIQHVLDSHINVLHHYWLDSVLLYVYPIGRHYLNFTRFIDSDVSFVATNDDLGK